MLKKMNEKKNNKGFSLVELIVVILIMAVLAVALAPQVMKWVNNARISGDIQTYKTIVSSCELAMTDEEAYKVAKASTDASKLTITFSSSGIAVTNDTDSKFQTALAKYVDLTNTKKKDSTRASYTITIVDAKITEDANVATDANALK